MFKATFGPWFRKGAKLLFKAKSLHGTAKFLLTTTTNAHRVHGQKKTACWLVTCHHLYPAVSCITAYPSQIFMHKHFVQEKNFRNLGKFSARPPRILRCTYSPITWLRSACFFQAPSAPATLSTGPRKICFWLGHLGQRLYVELSRASLKVCVG